MPVEIMAAARTVPDSRWTWALEQALDHSLRQVPTLSGRTLVLVDQDLPNDDASVFASALTVRSPASRWCGSVRRTPYRRMCVATTGSSS